jgi:cell fate (sporulation/competence/biofilm development) regulator YmcA (YheA/YmcA/DUF963 family)
MGFLADVFSTVGEFVEKIFSKRNVPSDYIANRKKYFREEEYFMDDVVRLKLSKEARDGLTKARNLLRNIASEEGMTLGNSNLAKRTYTPGSEMREVNGVMMTREDFEKQQREKNGSVNALAIQQEFSKHPIINSFRHLLDVVNTLDVVPASLSTDRQKLIASFIEKISKQLGTLPLHYQRTSKLWIMLDKLREQRERACSRITTIGNKDKFEQVLRRLDTNIEKIENKAAQFGYIFVAKANKLLDICDKVSINIVKMEFDVATTKIREETEVLLEGQDLDSMEADLDILSDETDAMLDAALEVDEDTECDFAKFKDAYERNYNLRQLSSSNSTSSENSDVTPDNTTIDENDLVESECVDTTFEIIDE